MFSEVLQVQGTYWPNKYSNLSKVSFILLELYLTNQEDFTTFALFTGSVLGFTATVQVLKGFAEVQVDEENLWTDILLFLP